MSDLNARVGYEGHEMIKTSFYRLRSRKKMEESYELAKVSVGMACVEGSCCPVL